MILTTTWWIFWVWSNNITHWSWFIWVDVWDFLVKIGSFHHYQNASCQVLSGPEEAGLALPQVQPANLLILKSGFCKVCVAKGPFQMRQQTMSLGIRPLMFLACAALRADVFTSVSGRSFWVKVLVPWFVSGSLGKTWFRIAMATNTAVIVFSSNIFAGWNSPQPCGWWSSVVCQFHHSEKPRSHYQKVLLFMVVEHAMIGFRTRTY